MAPTPLFLFLLLLLLSPPISATSTTANITALCSQTTYPLLCIYILRTTPLPTGTPVEQSIATVSAALTVANSTSTFLNRLPSTVPNSILDCKDLLEDATDQLSESVLELRQLEKIDTWESQVDNVITWVSAAMTNAVTCIDGAEEMEVNRLETMVVRRVTGVQRVCSVALFFVDQLKSLTSTRQVRV